MFITHEQHMVYFDHILHTYACQHSLATGMRNHLFDGRGFAEHQSSLLWSVSENPHTSLLLWDIWIEFCMLFYFNIAQPLVYKTVTRVCRASFWPVEVVSENVHNS